MEQITLENSENDHSSYEEFDKAIIDTAKKQAPKKYLFICMVSTIHLVGRLALRLD